MNFSYFYYIKEGDKKEYAARIKGDITVCVETTYNWYWIADLCLKLNIPFDITHAFYAKKKMIEKNKNYRIDAAGLAGMLLHEEQPIAYNYPPEMRATRDLLRLRCSLKKMRTGRLQHHSCVEDQYALCKNEWVRLRLF